MTKGIWQATQIKVDGSLNPKAVRFYLEEIT